MLFLKNDYRMQTIKCLIDHLCVVKFIYPRIRTFPFVEFLRRPFTLYTYKYQLTQFSLKKL